MSLPDIMINKPLPTISNMEIDTEVLDPISSSNQEVVFQIPKNGILDGGSFVSLAVRVPSALVDADGISNAFLPMNTGIYGLIRSAQLTIGGKVIASNEDFGHYATMIRQFETPEHRAYVEQVKAGNSLDRYGGLVGAGAGRLTPKDLEVVVEANDQTASLVSPNFIRPTDNDNSTPVFSLPLSFLIPMMRSRQLPVFAIKENCYLRIQFNQQTHGTQAGATYGNICCFANINGGGGVNANLQPVPSLANIKFYSDHLYYPENIMNATLQQMNSDKGMNMVYEDIVLTNTQIQAGTNPTAPAISNTNVERQIAVSGKVVRNIMIQQKTVGQNHSLLGAYISHTTTANDDYNFRINDNRYYDRNLENPCMKYNELSKVLSKPLQVPPQMYSGNPESNKQRADGRADGNSVYIGAINTIVLPDGSNAPASFRQNQLQRTSHYLGVDLTTTGFNVLGNGKRIGVKPIILQYNKKNVANDRGATEMRIYSNVERVLMFKNGSAMVSA